METRIGNVTKRRWNTLVKDGRKAVSLLTQCQFRLGDIALEIEPMLPKGGQHGAEVYPTLQMFADEIGIEFATLINYRSVASAWPEKKRVDGASWTVHRALASMPNRFSLIKRPPVYERTGERRWTADAAARVAGRTPAHPATPQEKVSRIHDLAVDDNVAATAATNFLHRPEVAHRVLSDPTARHIINRAQVDRGKQIQESARERMPVIRKIERSMQIIELLGACSAFVSAISRTMSSLQDEPVSDDERHAVHDHLSRVRAAADWCEMAIDTGDTTLDEQLAKLLNGDAS